MANMAKMAIKLTKMLRKEHGCVGWICCDVVICGDDVMYTPDYLLIRQRLHVALLHHLSPYCSYTIIQSTSEYHSEYHSVWRIPSA